MLDLAAANRARLNLSLVSMGAAHNPATLRPNSGELKKCAAFLRNPMQKTKETMKRNARKKTRKHETQSKKFPKTNLHPSQNQKQSKKKEKTIRIKKKIGKNKNCEVQLSVPAMQVTSCHVSIWYDFLASYDEYTALVKFGNVANEHVKSAISVVQPQLSTQCSAAE